MLSRRATLGGLIFAAAMTISTVADAHGLANELKALRDTRGAVVKSTSGHCVLLANQPGFDAECLGQRRQIALEDRTVYFNFNDSTLTEEAQAKLDSLMGILRREKDVKSLSIVGYADRIGSSSYNQALSRKRALTVRDYLAAQGFTNVNVTKTRWVGKSKPTAECTGNKKTDDLIACLAPDRKVEVEVNYSKVVKTMEKPMKRKAMKKKAAPAAKPVEGKME
jgi:outer membrane protein OmpA-like peptidoglycan-associated protein